MPNLLYQSTPTGDKEGGDGSYTSTPHPNLKFPSDNFASGTWFSTTCMKTVLSNGLLNESAIKFI